MKPGSTRHASAGGGSGSGTDEATLRETAGAVTSPDDLAAFISDLRTALLHDPERWENGDLGTFLEALAAWTADMDGHFGNRREEVPAEPSWSLVAKMLLAARSYE
jgi:hypothetical protein